MNVVKVLLLILDLNFKFFVNVHDRYFKKVRDQMMSFTGKLSQILNKM